MVAPFTLTHSEQRAAKLFTRMSISDCGIAFHSSTKNCSSSASSVGKRLPTLRESSAHNVSMGFRSGDRAGQSSRYAILFLWRKLMVFFAVWGRAPSCMKRRPFSTGKDGVSESWMYVAAVIEPFGSTISRFSPIPMHPQMCTDFSSVQFSSVA